MPGFDAATDVPVGVATATTCVAATPGLLHLSGNVWEWEDSCDPSDDDSAGVVAQCRVRGGAYRNAESNLACSDFIDEPRIGSTATSALVGFRCCAG